LKVKRLAVFSLIVLLAVPGVSRASGDCARRQAVFQYNTGTDFSATAKRYVRFRLVWDGSIQTVKWHRRISGVRIGGGMASITDPEVDGATQAFQFDRTVRSYSHDTADGRVIDSVAVKFRYCS
jgi:hypothetical protein